MKTSEAGLRLIKEFEGFRSKAYVCPAGVLTIGYGHTSAAGDPAVVRGMEITNGVAHEILRSDLERFERGVTRLVKVDLEQNQFDVLVSFAFNCGLGNLKKSTLLKRVNAKRFEDVPAELMKWTKGGGKVLPGLVRRRRAEAEMWQRLGAESESETRSTPDTPTPSKKITQSKEAGAAAVAGGAGAIAAAQEVIPAVQQAGGIISGLSEALGRPAVIAFIVVAIAAAGIWYWRKQRLNEEAA
jgi:GH24 family phage-related lysozyme (muramidase)